MKNTETSNVYAKSDRYDVKIKIIILQIYLDFY